MAEATVHGTLPRPSPRPFLVLLLLVDVMLRFALVPDRVRRDFLSRTLNPVARRRDQVVRKLFAEFVCKR